MTEIPKSQIELVDKLYWSPSERADGVHSILREALDVIPGEDRPSQWDILAFCVEFIGAQSIVLGVDEFLDQVKAVSRMFYEFHYSNPASIYGEPDKLKVEEDD